MTAHDERAVRTTFESRYGHRPTVTASAPGRVNIIGGHVDYNDGIVLPAAIDRSTDIAARERDDDRIRVYSERMDETVTAEPGADLDGWAAYVIGTAAVLARDTGESMGADLVVGGDMILGAGISSSASLEVAVAGALNELHGLGLDREQLADCCWRAENEEVGMACGIMDQFASALGQAGHALRIDCRSRDVRAIPFDPEIASLLVVDTTVTHELTDSGFNDRVRECHEATARLDALLDKRVRSLRDVSPEELSAQSHELEPPLDRRARHVTGEIQRVREAAEALEENRMNDVGALVRESHRSLREDYEVSCAELNTVVDALDDCDGVFGARMVGGGWGGSVAALIEPDAEARIRESVAEQYREATGIDCESHTFSFGDGLTVQRHG
ncbi:MAG: galactokinase [Halobaculum sp.]